MSLRELIESIAANDADFALLVESQDYEGIALYLNQRPLADNPDSQEQVPMPITPSGVLELLTDAEQAAIYRVGTITNWAATILESDASAETKAKVRQVGNAIAQGSITGSKSFLESASEFVQAGNREALGLVIEILLEVGTFSQSTHDTLKAALASTVPDPDYEAQVRGQSIAAMNGLKGVNAMAVQGALNG